MKNFCAMPRAKGTQEGEYKSVWRDVVFVSTFEDLISRKLIDVVSVRVDPIGVTDNPLRFDAPFDKFLAKDL